MKNIQYYSTLADLININNKYIDKNKEYLLLIAENTEFSFDILKKSGLKFFGAIVPQIVNDDINLDIGLLVIELDKNSKPLLIKDIKNFNLEKNDLKEMSSITLILDGLSSHITPFLESFFQSLPTNVEIIGGGAGKLTLEQEPVIFSNTGIYQDAALIIAMNSKLSIGIENAWEYLAGPFIVTSAEKNILKSLNFTNSFETYKQIVEKDSGKKFSNANFFDLAKSYPLGIVKFDNEIVVRDPIKKDAKGNLVLVGDIEQNSTVNILKGNKKSLITSSGKAIEKALANKKGEDISNVILFDCISRSIFLDDEFKVELKEIKKHIPNKKLFGALTLGEIANNGNEYINFYNKTCVVGVLC